MLPVIYGFWLGYVRTVNVVTTYSMHSLIKPVIDVVYSSMPSEEFRNIFQSVIAKQSCSLASTDWNMFWDSSDGIEEYPNSVSGFIN